MSLNTSRPRPSATAIPGRLLTTVLERVEPVEHEVGDRFPRRLDPEDPACLARMVNT
jgi:hypothetical protein